MTPVRSASACYSLFQVDCPSRFLQIIHSAGARGFDEGQPSTKAITKNSKQEGNKPGLQLPNGPDLDGGQAGIRLPDHIRWGLSQRLQTLLFESSIRQAGFAPQTAFSRFVQDAAFRTEPRFRKRVLEMGQDCSRVVGKSYRIGLWKVCRLNDHGDAMVRTGVFNGLLLILQGNQFSFTRHTLGRDSPEIDGRVRAPRLPALGA